MPHLRSRLTALVITAAAFAFTSCARQNVQSEATPPEASAFELRSGDRVVYLGDTLIEREQNHGWLDVMFASRFPDREVTFRNLGWSGDTPDGKSRLSLSLLQAGREPADEGWRQLLAQLTAAQPTFVVLGYGMANSFDGPAGLADFRTHYVQLLDQLREISPEVRFLFLSPIAHETLGETWPNPALHNTNLAAYTDVIADLAQAHHSPFVDLTPITSSSLGLKDSSLNIPPQPGSAPLTSNGIHLTADGYRQLAVTIEDQLWPTPGAWRTSPQTEPLRQAVLRKNQAFFNRSRPANMAYIFGFRKKEQGNNAVEVLEFDQLVAAEDQNIAALRPLRPTQITVPETRLTNRVLEVTPQAHPDFEVAEGFEVTLWAENPLINKPIHLNFDPQGRLWIASSTVYPQIEPGQAPADRILVLEDTTGQGFADKVTTFADGLLIPTGVLPGDHGVYVAQSTELLHFRDTDGDGVADEKRIVLSGFGTEDSHHNLHTPQWGPDGRLYMNQSVYTRTRTETPHGVVDLKAGGVFRFDPRDQSLSIHYRGLINGWGHAFDAFGQSFLSDGAGFEGLSWGVTGATYRTLAPARRILQTITPGSFPKYSGLEIVQSPAYPTAWQNDLITCDFRANRVVRFHVTDDGAGFLGREQSDVLRTTADSFRPIDVKMGPDGALYIADWSNPIIQHGEVDFRDTRRDKAHGRIWRVAPKATPTQPTQDITTQSNTALLNRLLPPHSNHQAQTRRVLTERGSISSAPSESRATLIRDLERWTLSQPSDAARLQALWLRQSLNLPLLPVAQSLLASPSGPTRAATVRALSLAGEDDPAALTALVADPFPRVRLEAVRALARFPSAASAAAALEVLKTPMDPFIDYALWLTINDLAEPWLAAVADGTWPFGASAETRDLHEAQLGFGLSAIPPAQAAPVLGHLLAQRSIPSDGSGPWIDLIQNAGSPAELRLLFDALTAPEFTPAATVAGLNALGEAARLRDVKPTGSLDAVGTFLRSPDSAVQQAAVQLVGAWKLAAFIPDLRSLARLPQAPDSLLDSVFDAIRTNGGKPAATALLELVNDETVTSPVRDRAALGLATQNLKTHWPVVEARLRSATTPGSADRFWRGLLAIKNAGSFLAAQLPSNPLPATVAEAGLRPAREGSQNETLVRVLLEQAGFALPAERLTSAQLIALATEADTQGDAARGELIYHRSALACTACHALSGAGGKVGPDLSSIGASAPTDYIVEALLYPNDKVKEGYHATLVTTKDDQAVSGVVVRQTAQELILRNPADQEISVALSNIASRTNIGSIMPAGLIDSLLPQERLDLVKFLSELGKPGPYQSNSTHNFARQWHLYLAWSGNRHLGVERVLQGDFTLPDWQSNYSLFDGTIPSVDYEERFSHRSRINDLYLATQFEAASTGPVTFRLDAPLGQAWLNGTAITPGEQFTVNVSAGLNILVFRTDPEVFPRELRLSAQSDRVTFSHP
jgi:putative heme-binding domain-containing protein